MQKKTLPYIEDYIEVLAGYVTAANSKVLSFNLARYDVQIIQSMCQQTTSGIAFTDRQAILAHKLVVKYKRQFANHALDVGFHEENGHFRQPVRMVDRTRSVRIENGLIHIRFPYETAMIDDLRDSGKLLHGNLKFDKESRSWVAAITEPRLLWLQDLVAKYQFELDDQAQSLLNQVRDAQNQPYQIELRSTADGFEIVNAPQSLTDYVTESLGGFGIHNATTLIDQSSILEYTLDPTIAQQVNLDYNYNQSVLLKNREAHIPLKDGAALDDIFAYAERTQRWPVYIFETVEVVETQIKSLLSKYFTPDQLLIVPAKQRKLDPTGYKCVYLNNWQTSWSDRIPLLVTMNALMVGPKKQHLIQQSEKVVYCTENVYNLK
jgi:hypothetical protein